jgi:hypothetical protein
MYCKSTEVTQTEIETSKMNQLLYRPDKSGGSQLVFVVASTLVPQLDELDNATTSLSMYL